MFVKVKNYVKNQWKGMDGSVRTAIVDFITKSSLYAFSGGGGAYLMKATLDKVTKLEEHVVESDKDLQELKTRVQNESNIREALFEKYDEANSEKFLKIKADVSELTVLKDIWLSSNVLGTEQVRPPANAKDGAKKDKTTSEGTSDDVCPPANDIDGVEKDKRPPAVDCSGLGGKEAVQGGQ